MKRFRKVINIIICTVVALYVAVTVVLHIPFVQRALGGEIASALSAKFGGTRVEIGSVDLGLLNRVIVDGVHIYDQRRKPMLEASRVSAKIDILPLFEGRISISSAQLFGMKAVLYRPSRNADTNFQFVLDSLASKDTTSHTPLDLKIGSLVIRNGSVKWDDCSAPRRAGFDVSHIDVSSLSSHILLNHLTDNSLDVAVRHFSLNESSGLTLKELAFKAVVDGSHATIRNFTMQMPGTMLAFPLIQATYRKGRGGVDFRSLRYNVRLADSYVSPRDLAFIEPGLESFKGMLRMSADIEGSYDGLNARKLAMEADDQSIVLKGSGSVIGLHGTPKWNVNVAVLKTGADGIQFVARNLRKHNVTMPEVITRLGYISLHGRASGQGSHIMAKGDVTTSAGSVAIDAEVDKNAFKGYVKTDGVELGKILGNGDFGKVIAEVSARGVLPAPFKIDKLDIAAKGTVSRFDYKGYPYRNISVDGSFRNTVFNGSVSMDDPNGKVAVDGLVGRERVAATVDVRHLNLHRLKITDALGNRTLGLHATADLKGADLDHLNGTLDISNLSAVGEGQNYNLKLIHASVRNNMRQRSADIQSDFGSVSINGTYDYQTIPQTFTSIVGHHLPSLFASRKPSGNAFSVSASLVNADILRRLFNIPLSVGGLASIDGHLDDRTHSIDLQIDAPSVAYGGNNIRNARIDVTAHDGVMRTSINGERIDDSGRPLSVGIAATAHDDNISFQGNWNLHGGSPAYGNANAAARLFRNSRGNLGFDIDILPSEEVFDTIRLAVQPSHVMYSHNLLDIDHFEVSNGDQRVTVNGQTTGSDDDSLLVDFRNINLKYVLDLVGFNSVEFTGLVTGNGYVKSFFSNPMAYATFDVDDFRFQGGEFGTLRARATYDNNLQRINVNSVADDGPDSYTDINGYVSIKDNYIDMPMRAHGTKMQFLEGFAGAVIGDVKARGDGWCRIFGDLSKVNLEGDMRCNGDMRIKQTNTVYTMRNSLIHMVPDEIEFANDTVVDRNGNIGIVTGALHHKNLHKMTFDIHVDADNLLCLNLPEFDGNTFRGVIYGTGGCDVIGRSGETTINANITPTRGSYMEYNAGYSGSLDDNSFIHWKDVTPIDSDSIRYLLAVQPINATQVANTPDIPSDFTMNLIVNTTPDFTLRVLTDESTGDHMDFHGDGVIRATYFNKGAFQMFGNYNVEFGDYTMTIQNLVKKVFEFQPGSSVTFGGNPFDANLNLKAQYTVNGVSLADLQMGRSFTSSNIRVNCLMNIAGTPLKPSVTFDLDMPTLSTDALQMVRSIMNSEEDMNQQVLYLLAVGRFYNPGSNNAEVETNASQSRTSLAMQSVLSGTLSQQISNVLSTVIHNTNWNFGANISTGDEGWSDAEYEGLLSGRMLNNRLFFQGQFGYRDKVTTNNSSFIGDFDLRYLLTPNGNFAVHVYNQTNDRYFTRNSLTTQGLGFIIKKDFNGWKDLFKRNKNKPKTKKVEKSH